MTPRELQTQVLQLPSSDRWELVQVLLESFKQESRPTVSKGNLSRLRGIARDSNNLEEGAIAPH